MLPPGNAIVLVLGEKKLLGSPTEVGKIEPDWLRAQTKKGRHHRSSRSPGKDAAELSLMPMPSPRESESRQKFIARFMSSETMQGEYPDHETRVAIAFKEWRRAGGSAPRKKTLGRYA